MKTTTADWLLEMLVNIVFSSRLSLDAVLVSKSGNENIMGNILKFYKSN
jgi:hypothetical protein